MLKILIPGAPVTKLRPRFSRFKGYVRTFDSQADEKETIRWQIKAKIGDHEPIEDAIDIELLFFMHIPKSTSKKKRVLMIGEPHTSKPDIDNLVKMYLDCMNGIVYQDDKQIYSIGAEKRYDENPRTEITVVVVPHG